MCNYDQITFWFKSANCAKSSVHSLNLGWKVNEYMYFNVHVSIMKILDSHLQSSSTSLVQVKSIYGMSLISLLIMRNGIYVNDLNDIP